MSTSDPALVVPRQVRAAFPLSPWFDSTAKHTLWVGVSGGVDSTVLLHVLRGLPRVAAFHIDHGLQGRSAVWAANCAATAAKWDVPFRVKAVAVSRRGNLQASARRARYQAWREVLKPGDVLALAHHADDQAETRLWQVLTGREPGGMTAQRVLGRGLLVRPMLRLRRREIVAYARRAGLEWEDDPANADLRFDRNLIRHSLLPALEQRDPRAFARLAAPPGEPPRVVRPLPASSATSERIAAWLADAGLPRARRAVREIHRQNQAARGRSPCVAVAPGVDARLFRRNWHLVRHGACDASRSENRRVTSGACAVLSNGVLGWREDAAGLPVGVQLAVRCREGGERIRLNGRNVRKTVKALFQEHGVPPWRRESWPLLYDDAGSLLAVPSIGVAAEAAVPDGLLPCWTPSADTLTADGLGIRS